MRKHQQRTLHERYGLSFNIEETASAKSLVRGLPQFGLSDSEVLVLPSAKRLRQFFTVEMENASVSSTDLNSAAIAEAQRPLSVRKRMTARCSINILNVQTRIEVLKTNTGVDLVGTTKIFEREIGEEEIVCRIQSFMIIHAHPWVG
jgi:hypothetical protein